MRFSSDVIEGPTGKRKSLLLTAEKTLVVEGEEKLSTCFQKERQRAAHTFALCPVESFLLRTFGAPIGANFSTKRISAIPTDIRHYFFQVSVLSTVNDDVY